MKTGNKFFILMILCSSIFTYAAINVGRGGGDEVGLEFQAMAAQGLSLVLENDLTASELEKVRKALDQADYYVVDTELFVTLLSGEKQRSTAVNDPKTMTVTIQRARWNAIDDQIVKMKLALHEVLSLVGIEHTGNYRISSKLDKYKSTSIINGAIRLYDRFYDSSTLGLTAESARKQCEYYKDLQSDDYSLVYCSYLHKRIPYQVGRNTFYDDAYGLAVYGVPKVSNPKWVVVFSSVKISDGSFGELVYDSESDAMSACNVLLVKNLSNQSTWSHARCFTEKNNNNKFYFEIRRPQ